MRTIGTPAPGHHRGRGRVAALGAILLVAACQAGSGEDPTDGSSPTVTADVPSTPTGATLGDWVEIPGPAYLLASDHAGRALVATGESAGTGSASYRDAVVAYDGATGDELWELEDVRETAQLPDVASDDETIALFTDVDGTDTLVGLDWATGAQRWSLPAADLGLCGPHDLVPQIAGGVLAVAGAPEACGPGAPSGIVTVDSGTGEVLDAGVEAAGTFTWTIVDEEIWALAHDDAGMTVHRFTPSTGELTTRSLDWSTESKTSNVSTAGLRPVGPDDMYAIRAFDDDRAVLIRWAGGGAAQGRGVLAWDAPDGAIEPFTGAPECFDWLSLTDLTTRTCLGGDLGSWALVSASFDGERHWEGEGQAGFVVDGWPNHEPVTAPGEPTAWLLSTGADLLTLTDAVTGEARWVVGEGEGTGPLTFGHLPGAGALVAAVQAGEEGQASVVRVDVATGEVLDRREVPGGWVLSTETAVVVRSAEASLLTVVLPGQ